MFTTKSATKSMKSLKNAAVDRIDHITTNEKIAGAAAIGVAVGVAATAIGSSLLHSSETAKTPKNADGKTPPIKA